MTSRHPMAAAGFRPVLTFAVPVLIFLSYLFLAVQPDLGLAVPELLGISGWIIILLAICQVNAQKTGHFVETGFLGSPAVILLSASFFRCLFLWRMPELSDDIYRYLFDGLMTLSKTNPYLDAPAHVNSVTPQMADLVPLINHAELPTIYPPAAQMVFAAGVFIARIPGISILLGMKLLLVVLDLFTCAIIINILSKLNLSKKRAILYAWHPLPVIEIAASGHIDAAAVFFVMAATGLVMVGRPGRVRGIIFSGIFIALAVLTKWFPLVFLPGIWLAVRNGFRRYLIVSSLATAGILVWPFLPEVVHGLQTLNTYIQNWEFSGFAFRRLRQWTGSGETARLMLASGFIFITGLAYGLQLRHNSPQQMVKSFFAIALAFLLLTPTLHPWYALYLTAFLPFVAGSVGAIPGMASAGLTISWAVFLAYRVLIVYRLQGIWLEDDVTAFWIVMAPAAAAVAGFVLRMARGRLRPHIHH